MTPFEADSGVVTQVVPSPNQGERRGGKDPEIIILHYTGMPDAEAALRRLCDPASEVSTHYFVFEDGNIIQCVPEARRAWHAGAAWWEGQDDVNSRSIGIEIANPGHEHGYRDFPSAQIRAATALCADIVKRRKIRAERVLAHSDVAPARKEDPGEKFPWDELHRAGVGHWVAPAPIEFEGLALRLGDSSSEVAAFQRALRDYGYELRCSAHYDTDTVCVVRAFQRHFRPARVDGTADASTRDTLQRLLLARFVSA